ncbi:MAG: hypothetical protein JNK48_15925 [Bryobacterales bacterium]|nr:hypothetical protein [Bryobacterales bacterium]
MSWVAALALLAVETPVLVRTAQRQMNRGVGMSRPFAVKLFEPIVISPNPSGHNLYWSDRVLEIDGRPITNRADLEEALDGAESRGTASVLVQHYPEDGEPWEEAVVADFRAREPAARLEMFATTAWFGGIVWPAVCVLLAAGVLAVNGESRRAWLAALLLAGAGHFAWKITTPYAWQEPVRSLMLVYDAAVTAAAPVALFAAAILWPKQRKDGWGRWLWRGGAVWAGANVAVQWGAKTSYALLSPFTFLSPLFEPGMVFLLVMVAGVTAAIRWSTMKPPDLTHGERSIAEALRRGTWSLQLSLGLLLIFLPMLMNLEDVLRLEPVVWVCYATSLGFPLAVAKAGSQPDDAPIEVRPLQPATSWGDLFEQTRRTAEVEIGLRMLALYGPEEGELRVKAAAAGGEQWPPIVDGVAPASAVSHWEPFERGFLAVSSVEGVDSRQREALRMLALRVGERAATLTATPGTAA